MKMVMDDNGGKSNLMPLILSISCFCLSIGGMPGQAEGQSRRYAPVRSQGQFQQSGGLPQQFQQPATSQFSGSNNAAAKIYQPTDSAGQPVPENFQRFTGTPRPPLVPGTGEVVTEVADDFEDENWDYIYNTPKIYNNGETTLNRNVPAGISVNQLWYEGPKRGQPDLIQRVPTPEGGLPGSQGALLLRSLQTGGAHPSFQQQQDDFVCNVINKLGKVPVSLSPSVVTRVYFPPMDQWERRTGCHFAFRASLETETPLHRSAGYQSSSIKIDESWPGIFVNMEIKNPQYPPSETNPVRIFTWLKADHRGHQLKGPEITQMGWWTFGMSFTPDGQVHYYAKPGVEDLTEADHITSSFPYGQNAARLRNFFFNVCNGDDGKTWSTTFIVDDPKLYVIK